MCAEALPREASGHEAEASPGTATPARRAPVSIVIPTYNEEKAIGTVLRDVKEAMTRSGREFEIVVVDDGSGDGTVAAAEAAGVRVLRHGTNRGYGAALKTGLRHARQALVCITDADGTYPSERLPDLLDQLNRDESDMVVGARTGTDVAIPWVRRPAKWIIGWLATLVAGAAIPDVNSGLRVFRRQVALVFVSLLPDGFSFTTTLTLAMLSNGYLVGYLPVSYYQRVGRSKIRPIRDTLNFVQLILRIALYFAPLKIFLPVSALLVLLGIGWGVFSLKVLGHLADVSTVVIIMAGIQVAVIGLLAELVNRRLPNYYRPEE